MRVSIVKSDPGFRYNFDPKRVRVYLDGKELKDAVTADEERGTVLMYALDEKGLPKIDAVNKSYVMEERQGIVRVDIVDDNGNSIKLPKIELKQDPDNNDTLVLVFSRLRPNQIRRMRIEHGVIGGMTKDQKSQMVGVVAGAAAEYLCETYGDIFDPSEVSRYAVDEALKFFTMN